MPDIVHPKISKSSSFGFRLCSLEASEVPDLWPFAPRSDFSALDQRL